MPSSYNGNAANATGTQVTITNPADGDSLTAASATTFSKLLADWAQRFLNFILGPAVMSLSSSSTGLAITNTGTGAAASFTQNNAGGGNAVNVTSNAAGQAGVASTASGAGSFGLSGIAASGTGATGAGVNGVSQDSHAWGGAFTAGPTPAVGAINSAPQVTPSAPSNGDIWVDVSTAALSARVSGSTLKLLPQTAPVTISSFLNSVSAGTPAPRYWRDSNGVVHLDGQVSRATAGFVACFNLPAGFRPTQGTASFVTVDNNGIGSVFAVTTQVATGGNVSCNFQSTSDTVNLDGITFPTF